MDRTTDIPVSYSDTHGKSSPSPDSSATSSLGRFRQWLSDSPAGLAAASAATASALFLGAVGLTVDSSTAAVTTSSSTDESGDSDQQRQLPFVVTQQEAPPAGAEWDGTSVHPRILEVYEAAAEKFDIPREFIAGIAANESGHGTADGAVFDPECGDLSPHIYGFAPVGTLSTPLTAEQQSLFALQDAEPGATSRSDYAMGPMQILASTYLLDSGVGGIKSPLSCEAPEGSWEAEHGDPHNYFDSVWTSSRVIAYIADDIGCDIYVSWCQGEVLRQYGGFGDNDSAVITYQSRVNSNGAEAFEG